MRAPYSPVRLIYGKNSKIGHSLSTGAPYSPENTVYIYTIVVNFFITLPIMTTTRVLC